MTEIESYRSLFPITEKFAFFNSAAVSSPSLRVCRVVEELAREFSHEGISRYGFWMKRIEGARESFARLISADPDEIAFTGNTSDGLSIVANGLAWQPGDGILVPDPDFPANVYPWMNLERLGVKLHFYPRRHGRIHIDDVERALRPGTKLLAVSSVDFTSGFRCDLEALGAWCRSKGLLLCVDAIQSLGVVPMDVRRFGIHFLSAGGHKWLLSMMGTGGLFVSREVRSLLHPARVGWRSVNDENNFEDRHFDLKTDARRFETGTYNVAGIAALGTAVDLLLEVGIERIYDRVIQIADGIVRGLQERNLEILTPLEPEERSGIVTFIPPGHPEPLFEFLASRNVMVSARGAGIRLATHFYNNERDVESFFAALDDYLKTAM